MFKQGHRRTLAVSSTIACLAFGAAACDRARTGASTGAVATRRTGSERLPITIVQ